MGWRLKREAAAAAKADVECMSLSIPHHSERRALRLGVAAEECQAHRFPLGPGGPGDAAWEGHRRACLWPASCSALFLSFLPLPVP